MAYRHCLPTPRQASIAQDPTQAFHEASSKAGLYLATASADRLDMLGRLNRDNVLCVLPQHAERLRGWLTSVPPFQRFAILRLRDLDRQLLDGGRGQDGRVATHRIVRVHVDQTVQDIDAWTIRYGLSRY